MCDLCSAFRRRVDMSHLQGRSGAYHGSVSGIEDRGEGGGEDEESAGIIIMPSDVW